MVEKTIKPKLPRANINYVIDIFQKRLEECIKNDNDCQSCIYDDNGECLINDALFILSRLMIIKRE